ncbi:flavoprotein [Pseudonocardia acaciae]|uniref:flavoprotein n=1 Tax=Pseudonocardia acaciae TaxID=551276 RepID=UPI0009FDD301|nr:flavoprotein [Pseudonocardia acaciae]
MADTRPARRVVYLVACAAPPAQAVGDLVRLLQEQGWTVCVIATPRAFDWLEAAALADQTGYPVRHEYKRPSDPDSLPLANSVAVAPATFNTINKWTAGISDTFALGILNEAIGLKLPIVVAPYAKPSLAAHPAFERSLEILDGWGVKVLPNEVIRVKPAKNEFEWRPVVAALA